MHKPSDNKARGTKRLRDDKRERQGNIEPKRARQSAEHASIKEKIDKWKNSIGLLQAHLEKGTCPKSLRYNVRANIMPDENFKSDVSSIKKRTEHDCGNAGEISPQTRRETDNKNQKTQARTS